MSESAFTIYAPIALMLVLGLPHGALDAHILNSAARRKRQKLILLLAYIALALATIVFWRTLPTIAIAMFLGLSTVHFGRSDLYSPQTINASTATVAKATTNKTVHNFVMAVTHGGIWTVLLPLVQWDRVEPIFSTLESQTLTLKYLLQGSALAWGACSIVTIFSYIQTREIGRLTLLFTGISVAIFTPPLWALCLYFCLWHARRHTSWVLSHFPPKSAALKFMFIFSAIPLAAMLYFALFIPHKLSFDEFALQLFFVGIFALTVPHMVLIDYYLGSKPTVDR